MNSISAKKLTSAVLCFVTLPGTELKRGLVFNYNSGNRFHANLKNIFITFFAIFQNLC